MAIYQYEIEGSAAEGQTWRTTGIVRTIAESEFPEALNEAVRQSFMQLTQGKAIYGQPGVACRGPYQITRFGMARKTDA